MCICVYMHKRERRERGRSACITEGEKKRRCTNQNYGIRNQFKYIHTHINTHHLFRRMNSLTHIYLQTQFLHESNNSRAGAHKLIKNKSTECIVDHLSKCWTVPYRHRYTHIRTHQTYIDMSTYYQICIYGLPNVRKGVHTHTMHTSIPLFYQNHTHTYTYTHTSLSTKQKLKKKEMERARTQQM
jgi:hypothetical protein